MADPGAINGPTPSPESEAQKMRGKDTRAEDIRTTWMLRLSMIAVLGLTVPQMVKQYFEETEIHESLSPITEITIPDQDFKNNPKEWAEIEALIKSGATDKDPDPVTKNYHQKAKPNKEGKVIDLAIKGPMARAKVDGIEITLRKPVLERYLAAWRVLNEYGIHLKSAESFRTNLRQAYLFDKLTKMSKTDGIDYDVANLISSEHIDGAAVDQNQVSVNDAMTSEGMVIRDVMIAFGFRHGVRHQDIGLFQKGRMGPIASDVLNEILAAREDEKSYTEAILSLGKNLKIRDRIHFEMDENTMSKTTLVEADKKARETLDAYVVKMAEQKPQDDKPNEKTVLPPPSKTIKEAKKRIIGSVEKNPALIQQIIDKPEVLMSDGYLPQGTPEQKEGSAELVQLLRQIEKEKWAQTGLARLRKEAAQPSYKVPKGFGNVYFPDMPLTTKFKFIRIYRKL